MLIFPLRVTASYEHSLYEKVASVNKDMIYQAILINIYFFDSVRSVLTV